MTIRQLQMLASAIGATAVTLSVVGVSLSAGDGSPLVAAGATVATGAAALVAIGWVRQRPIPPDDAETYAATAVIKLGIAEIPVLIGFVLAVAVGPGWPAMLGLAMTAAGLAAGWPSAGDRERHQLLYLA